jgi:hypothetical protein
VTGGGVINISNCNGDPGTGPLCETGPNAGDCCPNGDSDCAGGCCGNGSVIGLSPPSIDATHGGQVGSPVGVATPFTPDSECIKGEWTHVRHIRPKLFGNFHARSFDSLECACLSCCENPNSTGVVDDPKFGPLCNPDDRICGPEPRRAPANKICFSGVGDYAETNGKRDRRSVVFRVDIEDRSEPGGTNGPPPPDHYLMRIWLLSDLGITDENGPEGMALREQIACNPNSIGILSTTDTLDCSDLAGCSNANTPAPSITDGGDLYRGNHQLHPEHLMNNERCTAP